MKFQSQHFIPHNLLVAHLLLSKLIFLINLLFSGRIYHTVVSPCTFKFKQCSQLYLTACAHLYLLLSSMITHNLVLLATWFYLHSSFSLLLEIM